MSQRPDEDEAQRSLPQPPAQPETTQRLRISVPVPATELLLGQRLPAGSAPAPPAPGPNQPVICVEQDPGFGYPGVTLSTQAGAFVDVKERSVWQGHDTVTFQSGESLDVIARKSVCISSVPEDAFPADAPRGLFVDTTRFATARTDQLRRYTIEYNTGIEARALLSALRAVLSAKWLTLPFKLLSLVGAGAGVVMSGIAMGKAAPADMQPPAGVQITSSDPIFLASGAGQNFYAAGGFSFVGGVPIGKGKVPIPSSFSVSVPMSVSLVGGLTADMFGTITASLHAGGIADIAAIKSAGVFSRMGEAELIGATVKVGSKLPGEQILKYKANVLFQRPTTKVTISALKTVEIDPILEFKVNSPLGHFESKVRKMTVDALTAIKLHAAKGLYVLELSPYGIKMANKTGLNMVEIDLVGTKLKCGPFEVKATPASLTVGGPSAKATFTPVGVKIDGPVIKLG